MPDFTFLFNDNSTETVRAKNKDDLIRDYCQVDATRFQEEVKEIHWKEHDKQCMEIIATGEIKCVKIQF